MVNAMDDQQQEIEELKAQIRALERWIATLESRLKDAEATIEYHAVKRWRGSGLSRSYGTQADIDRVQKLLPWILILFLLMTAFFILMGVITN